MSALPQLWQTDFRALPAANEPAVGEEVRALHATVVALVAAVESLTVEVAALRAGQRTRPAPRLLSFRAAARALGVSRNRTLPALIREKKIRTVTVNGKTKVPLDEVERIGREGVGSFRAASSASAPRAARTAPLARDLV